MRHERVLCNHKTPSNFVTEACEAALAVALSANAKI